MLLSVFLLQFKRSQLGPKRSRANSRPAVKKITTFIKNNVRTVCIDKSFFDSLWLNLFALVKPRTLSELSLLLLCFYSR